MFGPRSQGRTAPGKHTPRETLVLRKTRRNAMQRQSARRAREWRIVAVLSSAFLAAYCGSGSNSADLLPGIRKMILSAKPKLGRGCGPGSMCSSPDSNPPGSGASSWAGLGTYTGIGADGSASIDRLFEHPSVQLVALFSPEHGIRADRRRRGAGRRSGWTGRTGLPIHSLYGATLKPTPSMLEGIEAAALRHSGYRSTLLHLHLYHGARDGGGWRSVDSVHRARPT